MSEAANGEQRRGYRGYATHHRFGGLRIPVPVQNIVLRNYANQHHLMFVLSADEFDFPGCYLQLNSLVKQLESLEGLLMCSARMLPQDPKERSAIYSGFLAHGATLHLVLDNIVASDPQDFERIEELLVLSETLESCPTSIPEALLAQLAGIEAYG